MQSDHIPLSVLLENTLFGFAFIKHRKILRANQKMAELFGYHLDDIVNRTTEHLYPDRTSFEEVGRNMYNMIRAQGDVRFERTMRRSNGSLFYCRFEGRALDRNLPENGTVWTLSDVTRERVERERALLHTGLFEKSAQAIIITDSQAFIIAVNSAFTRITGYQEQEVIGRNPRMFQSGVHSPDFYQNLWSTLTATGQWHGEIWNRRKDGSIYPELLQIIAIRNQADEIENFVAFFSDLSGQKEIEAQLEQVSSHDHLTGLPRRTRLLEHMRLRLNALDPNNRLAVLALDINQFKRFNQAEGLEAGDQLLRAFGQRLQQLTGPQDFAARMDGDEFIILHPVQEKSGLMQFTQNLVAKLSEPYYINKGEYHISISAGVSIAPSDGNSAELLIQYATLAQNRGRRENMNSVEFFRFEMNLRSRHYMQLEREIRLAIQKDEFQVHYQPQFSRNPEEIVGLEALVRWQHPSGKLIMPGVFVPAAEDLGLIRDVNHRVLRIACMQAVQWLRAGYQFGRLSVNCSAPDLLKSEFVESVEQVLQETGFPAECLTVEITESMAILEPQKSALVLNQLRALGIRIAMDDFGTGYCSINTLRSIPIDYLKLDRSFVRDMLDNAEARALTETILSMSRVLGYEVIAEGVENQQQRDMLVQFGCQVFQGYLYSYPLPTEQMQALFRPINN
ncbi:MAG: EAL domain-containing protein [Leptospiraceae bacterium]|nr:EAL domain-containing protein [Leptospiraceae bacterium]